MFRGTRRLDHLLHDLAARVGTATDEHEYGDNKAVWFEDGNKILGYVETDEHFNAPVLRRAWKSSEIFPNENDLATLIDHMRSLARQWRSSIGEHSVLHRCLLNPTDATFRCGLHVYQALSSPTNIAGAQAKPQPDPKRD